MTLEVFENFCKVCDKLVDPHLEQTYLWDAVKSLSNKNVHVPDSVLGSAIGGPE